MKCEICGKREAKLVVIIEGAEMNACYVCGKNAKIIGRIGRAQENKEEVIVEREETKGLEEEERIIEGFGEQIRKARMKIGLSREELAKKINEKESYLKHIEREEMVPNDKILKKLEKALGIKLKEKIKGSFEKIKLEEKKEESLEDVAEIEGEL